MEHEHYSEEELLARLYGLAPEDQGLIECPWCSRRWRALLERRAVVKNPLPVAETLLTRQRKAVTQAMERPARRWLPVAAVATVSTVILGVMLSFMTLKAPRPPAQPAPQEISDTELMVEVYTAVSATEPQALDPVRALFEVEP